MISRRSFLRTGLAAAAGASLPGCRSEREPEAPRWDARAHRKRERSDVAILRAESYEGDLVGTVKAGLKLFPLEVADRRVVLKPNLVEFDPLGVINTHPAVLSSAIEAFLQLGAREVVVAEGPGHRRDNEYLLTESGLADVLRDTGTRYVDLNQDSVRPVRLLSHYTALGRLYLPETVLGADLLVSMPKLKTHHWAAVTLSMKNMFGVVPGAVYGWPKNVLHWAGIGASIIDINAALEVPRFNIVDGIIGMQGNGPIQGDPRPAGVLVFGDDPVAVDATCARLMSIDPWKVRYLSDAEAFLGNIAGERIAQLAEDVDPLRQDFRVLESFEELKVTPRAAAG
jgi:uncharacterized protein (DUF362 family)